MRKSAQDRQQQVLTALVQLFIERREPVSSRMLEESGLLDVRSASIRAVLQELESAVQGLVLAVDGAAGKKTGSQTAATA